MVERIQIDSETYLRELTADDAAALYALMDVNRDYLSQWLGWVAKNKEMKDSERFIQFSSEKGKDGSVTLGVFYQEQFAGLVSYHAINFLNKRATLGYWIGQQYAGKGLATRATRYLVDNAFKMLGLIKVEILCATGNKASQKVAENLQFTKDGILRHNEIVEGRILDHFVYSMLKDEWAVLST